METGLEAAGLNLPTPQPTEQTKSFIGLEGAASTNRLLLEAATHAKATEPAADASASEAARTTEAKACAAESSPKPLRLKSAAHKGTDSKRIEATESREGAERLELCHGRNPESTAHRCGEGERRLHADEGRLRHESGATERLELEAAGLRDRRAEQEREQQQCEAKDLLHGNLLLSLESAGYSPAAAVHHRLFLPSASPVRNTSLTLAGFRMMTG
jgi:hypothetical protein